MLHFNRLLLTTIVSLSVVTACTMPPVFVPDTDAISTSAAQTVVAKFTQSAPPPGTFPTTTFTPSFTPTATFAPPTFTQTQTGTAIFLLTITPLVPFISVSIPTNCRVGPGKVYENVGALLVGESAQIYARDPTNKYWYIRNPDSNTEFCWVWGEYGTITGNFSIVPIYTPPPTPTPTLTPTPAPDFEMEYTSLDSCTGWWVELKLRNTGVIAFKSVGVTVKDTETGTTLSNLTDGFTDINGCLTSTTKGVLDPDKALIISAPAFMYDPTGHKINATVTLCSNTGQSGTCVTRTIKFTP